MSNETSDQKTHNMVDERVSVRSETHSFTDKPCLSEPKAEMESEFTVNSCRCRTIATQTNLDSNDLRLVEPTLPDDSSGKASMPLETGEMRTTTSVLVDNCQCATDDCNCGDGMQHGAVGSSTRQQPANRGAASIDLLDKVMQQNRRLKKALRGILAQRGLTATDYLDIQERDDVIAQLRANLGDYSRRYQALRDVTMRLVDRQQQQQADNNAPRCEDSVTSSEKENC